MSSRLLALGLLAGALYPVFAADEEPIRFVEPGGQDALKTRPAIESRTFENRSNGGSLSAPGGIPGALPAPSTTRTVRREESDQNDWIFRNSRNPGDVRSALGVRDYSIGASANGDGGATGAPGSFDTRPASPNQTVTSPNNSGASANAFDGPTTVGPDFTNPQNNPFNRTFGNGTPDRGDSRSIFSSGLGSGDDLRSRQRERIRLQDGNVFNRSSFGSTGIQSVRQSAPETRAITPVNTFQGPAFTTPSAGLQSEPTGLRDLQPGLSLRNDEILNRNRSRRQEVEAADRAREAQLPRLETRGGRLVLPARPFN